MLRGIKMIIKSILFKTYEEARNSANLLEAKGYKILGFGWNKEYKHFYEYSDDETDLKGAFE
jgi:hypothetical protein